MITNENKFLVKLIFPNLKCLTFFKDQLFEELKEVIPEKLCYSADNKNIKVRTFNKNECLNLIREFFINNSVYKEEVEKLYKHSIDEVIESILKGFVFLLKNGINVFEDKNSVCFVDMLNLLEFL